MSCYRHEEKDYSDNKTRESDHCHNPASAGSQAKGDNSDKQ
jgi:hypothetical protein